MNSSKNNDIVYIKPVTSSIKFTINKYRQFALNYQSIPITIKILNIIIPFIITYYYTSINFNKLLSITFAIITFFVISLLSKAMALIFIVLYFVSIADILGKRTLIYGIPVIETDIIRNGLPFSCINNSLTIPNTQLSPDLNGGYFTYSYWLYINGTDNDINKKNNWYNYRYDEWKLILYRGNAMNSLIPSESDGEELDLTGLTQFPGFWLTPKLNNLVIVFQNNSYVERLEVNNIEFNKWINITVIVELKSVSIYINGLLERTLNLYQNTTIMNQYNIYVGNDKLLSKNNNESGFAGSIAELVYYNYALNVNQVMESYKYYKKIMDDYQNNYIKNNYTYNGSKLITNSDIFK